MSVTLTIRDETLSGNVVKETPFQLTTEQMTVRDLIRERIYQEVQDFNRMEGERIFRGFVQPTETERTLNGPQAEYHLKRHRLIDWKEQYDKAIQSYERNGFVILIDNKQAEGLDQSFTVTPRTEISFVKLTMLVGG